MTWAVFLDRDGVLTGAASGDPVPLRADDLRVLPEAAKAVALLHGLGGLVFVVTNQPDVARGGLAPAELELMHERLVGELGVDGVRTCPHDNESGCACRKPAPGLLLELAIEHGVTLEESWMVGDRWVDIAAGRAAGVRTILVERQGSWAATSTGLPPPGLHPDAVVTDVLAAAHHIAATRGAPGSEGARAVQSDVRRHA